MLPKTFMLLTWVGLGILIYQHSQESKRIAELEQREKKAQQFDSHLTIGGAQFHLEADPSGVYWPILYRETPYNGAK